MLNAVAGLFARNLTQNRPERLVGRIESAAVSLVAAAQGTALCSARIVLVLGQFTMETESTCPYCGEAISLWIDEGGGAQQRYVEDCSVCCRPITVYVTRDEDGEMYASVQREDD